jgi:phosphogluconate dehydratase
VAGEGGLARYREEPRIAGDGVVWRDGPGQSLDRSIVRPFGEPFGPNGGLKLLTGNLGRAVIKVSAVKPERWLIEAPALIFEDQAELQAAFQRGELERDFVAVVRFQGPKANGMPELHKLTPPLGVLQDRGYKVALVTDGRMSGASGKVPAAIHVPPAAADAGPLARLRAGDLIRLDARQGRLDALVDAAEWSARTAVEPDLARYAQGLGRELFGNFRAQVTNAERGAAAIGFLPEPHANAKAAAHARL